MAIKSYGNFLKDIKKTLTYKIEKAKVDFVVSINAHMKDENVTRKVIAEKLNCTAPNVSRLLAGDENMTIETMVRLADAVGGELDIKVINPNERICWAKVFNESHLDLKENNENSRNKRITTAWKQVATAIH